MNPLAVAAPAAIIVALSTGVMGAAPERVVAPAAPVEVHEIRPRVGVVEAGSPALVRGDAGRRRATPALTSTVETSPRGRWQWPMQPRPPVVRRFEPPASTWGRGHRGIDLGGIEEERVLAVAAGTVSHVGLVAGRPTVSLEHPDGLRSTYEPVTPSVAVGDHVTAGTLLGTLTSARSHCLPRACLHLGALRGRAYLDPLSLLSTARVRLLPLWREPGQAPDG